MLVTLFFGWPLLHPRAQSAADPPAPKICLFDHVDLSQLKTKTAELQRIIYDALEVALLYAGFEVIDGEITRARWQQAVVLYERGEADRLAGRYVVQEARKLGADIAVTGFFQVEDESRVLDEARILLAIKGYDVKSGSFVAGRIAGGRGITLHNVISDAVSEIAPLFGRFVPSEEMDEESETETPPLKEVFLYSEDEDAEVFWAGEKPAGTVVNGAVRLETVPDTELTLEVRKEGYHPRLQVFDLRDRRRRKDPPEKNDDLIRLDIKPLARESAWGSEFTYTLGQALGLGFGIRYYLRPDSLFLTGEDYFFLQHALGTGASPVYHNDLRLLLGSYLLLPPTSFVRFGISTGLGIVISGFSTPGMPLYTDLYANFLNWWIELNGRKWIFFLRQEGRYMLGIFNNLLPAGWHSGLPWGLPLSAGFIRKWPRN